MKSWKAEVELADEVMSEWGRLSRRQKERVAIKMLRETEVGRKIARGAMPFIPYHMWNGKPAKSE